MKTITVQTTVNAPIEKVWECWNDPKHLTYWAFANDDWEAKDPENDLRVGGKFQTTMAARDGSLSFDFTGAYTEVVENKLIAYTMDDKRKVRVEFSEDPDGVRIVESFEPEQENSADMQQQGWQAILDNFKKYVEGLK